MGGLHRQGSGEGPDSVAQWQALACEAGRGGGDGHPAPVRRHRRPLRGHRGRGGRHGGKPDSLRPADGDIRWEVLHAEWCQVQVREKLRAGAGARPRRTRGDLRGKCLTER